MGMNLIDCGAFAVWSYQRPHLHTRDARRMAGPMVTEWAFCLRNADGSWQTSSPVSGFGSEGEARAEAMKRLPPAATWWRCRRCGQTADGPSTDTCASCGGTMAKLPEDYVAYLASPQDPRD